LSFVRHFQLIFYLALALFSNCKSNKSSDVSANMRTVTAISNGQIAFSDGSTLPIPHYNDPAYTTFYCVRHCEKAKDSPDPDLTAEGRARAEKLGRVMDNAYLNIVATTKYKRTIQTGEAVHRYAGDPDFVSFPTEMQDSWLQDQFVENAGKHIFYVGHQNTVPQLLNKLVGSFQFQNIPDTDFDHLYIAVSKGIGQTEVLDLKY
jgi:2,3-bisphosphoglycerate-dependent phosphoglycerate mutase